MAVGMAVCGPATVRADDVAAYLQRHGLTELLAVHLEQHLGEGSAEEQEERLVRLAELYAELLETVTEPVRRAELEQRGRRLIAEAPESRTTELRYALLAAAYRGVEHTAENHRLRLVSDADLGPARERLADLIPELQRLRHQLEEQADRADRRLERAAEGEAMVLAEKAEKARQLHMQCTFVTAWALYYQSWLNDRSDNARVAQGLFAELLDLGDQPPLPGNVSVDLRGVEAFARCILGMALCRSLTASSAGALEWVALLEHEQTFAPLREEAKAWRLAVHLEHDEFADVRSILESSAEAGEVIPLHWLRLVAVHALEAASASPEAPELARFAVTELAARGELTQVLDMARRYGVDALGSSGFAVRYVRAIIGYHEARERHGGDQPTGDADIAARYAAAAADFAVAMEMPDAARYPSAAADCGRLVAWCAFFEGRLLDARDAFVAAADRLPPDEAGEAMWMAIVCLDRLVEVDRGHEGLADELVSLIDRFLAEYPASPHAPHLVLRRSMAAEAVTPGVVDELLAIPANSAVYAAARRRAAQILYQLFREAPVTSRGAYGHRYLSVAVPLFGEEEQRLSDADEATRARLVVHGRRILEVALNEAVERPAAALSVLTTFDAVAGKGLLDVGEYEAELLYRRLQIQLIDEATTEAATLADRLWETHRGSVWSRLGSRGLLKCAVERWRDEPTADDRPLVAMIVRYGLRVLDEYAGDGDALQDAKVLTYTAIVADAAMTIWERSRDEERGRTALALYEQLLEARPRNARFLRAAGLLREHFGDADGAIECWRTLLAGSGQATDGWFEAKFHLVNLLAAIDPARAREVIEQHTLLNPEYGPDPWGARIRAVERRLAVSVDGETAEPVDAATDDGDTP